MQNQLPEDPLSEISLKKLGKRIKTKEVSCEKLTKTYLERISLLNKNLHSYIYVDEAGVIENAVGMDKLLKSAHEIKQNKRRETLIENKDKALISKQLVTLKKDSPIKVELT